MRNAKLGAAAAAAAVVLTASINASAIPVANQSFESPPLPNIIPSAIPGAEGWNTTGNDLSDPGAPVVNTGTFRNLDSDIPFGPGVTAKRIQNAHGSEAHADGHTQLAFIGANNPAGPGDNRFFQQLPASFAAGEAYTLSVGVAKSSVQPPSPGADLRIALYYELPGGAQVQVASTLVDESQVPDNNLAYFTAATPIVSAGAEYVGLPINVLVTTADNSAATVGTFDFDNVTVVPEPAAGLLIPVALAAAATRRRRNAR